MSRVGVSTVGPVPAPGDDPVVRIVVSTLRPAQAARARLHSRPAPLRAQMDDGESYLTHELGAEHAGDGRIPQLSFTQTKSSAKLFQLTDWNESTRTFALRCDLGFVTNESGEVRAGAKRKGKTETWAAQICTDMSNVEQVQAGFLEVWSASKRDGSSLAGAHDSERGWRVDSAASASGVDKLAADVRNKSSDLLRLSQFRFEAVPDEEAREELSTWSAASGKQPKRPLSAASSSGNSLMQISQQNQKKMRKSGGAVKPAKEKKIKAPKGAELAWCRTRLALLRA